MNMEGIEGGDFRARGRRLGLIALVFALAGLAADAGTLRLGSPVVNNNQYTFPVLLQGNTEGVAALDFRLAYDPAVFAPVSAQSGTNAIQAQKQVSSNIAVPGEFVVVMMGFNQNTVAAGEVVEVVLRKIGEPAGGKTTLHIAEPTLANPVGVEVESRGLGRTVDFDTARKQEKTDTDTTGAEEAADEDPAASPEENTPPESTDGRNTDRISAGVPIIVSSANNPGDGGGTPSPAGGSSANGTLTNAQFADGEAVNTAATVAGGGQRGSAEGTLDDAAPEARRPEVARESGIMPIPNGETADTDGAGVSSQHTDAKDLRDNGRTVETPSEKDAGQRGNRYATLLLLAGGVAVGFYLLFRVLAK